jgi:hypothetical protein
MLMLLPLLLLRDGFCVGSACLDAVGVCVVKEWLCWKQTCGCNEWEISRGGCISVTSDDPGSFVVLLVVPRRMDASWRRVHGICEQANLIAAQCHTEQQQQQRRSIKDSPLK